MKNPKVQKCKRCENVKSKRCKNVKSKRCENVKKINAVFENPKILIVVILNMISSLSEYAYIMNTKTTKCLIG